MPDAIFVPSAEAVESSQLTAFTRVLEARLGHRFQDYAALHRFSVAAARVFWSLFLEWSGLVVEGEREPVCAGDDVERAVFFPGLRLSYVQNLLSGEDGPALVGADERGRRVRLSRAELGRRVLAAAASLQKLGVGPDSRVVAVASNTIEAVVACLSCAALGASWSGVVTVRAGQTIVERGPYAVVRHPLYASLLLLATGTLLAHPSVATSCLALGFGTGLALKIRVEERALRRVLGPAWDHYAARVPALVPRLRRGGSGGADCLTR